MIDLLVNGYAVQARENISLLSFLRDELRLTSVKDGCGEGACGACTVLLDGKKARACIQITSRLAGHSVLTVEGLSEREKEVYAYCFAAAGAVQCGFCIPGMVLAAKSLLDKNDNPNEQEIRQAIRGNICRCTGYVKIIQAISHAARMLREDLPLPLDEQTGRLNTDFIRVDAKEKVLGTGLYADDIVLPGMIYGKALRSKYPRARINALNTTSALAHPDCVCVLTAADVPHNKIGHLVQDWDVMIPVGKETRYIGDAIALVATHHRETLDEVLALIEVDYTELQPLTSPEEALLPDAPALHEGGNIMRREKLCRGDAEAAIADSKYVITRHYSTPFNEHAFMEPECAVAAPDGSGGLRLYTGSQSVYDEQREISLMLGIAPEKVRSTSMLVGGGFGGKEDMSVQHHAALLAWYTGMPVKVKFSREESIKYHTKRHAMEMEFTTACDESGRLTAMKARIVADTGAYASLGGPVLQRACTHAAGPYNYQNIDIEGMSVYTNNVVGGAYRGFGVTQSCFATENNLNLLAEMAGISPWEIRYKNAIRPGQTLPNGQLADENCALAECLESVRNDFESSPYSGIACGFKNSGVGVGLTDIGRVLLSVEQGRVHIRSSAACMGQGIATVCVQMLCQTTGLAPALFVVEAPDTLRTPDSGTSTASRQTVLTGEAARRAAEHLREDLIAGFTLDDLEGKEYYGEFSALTDPLGSMKEHPVSHVSYSYAAQVVELNEEGRVRKVTAAYDVGTPVNLPSAEGQIEGGIVMGLGFALTEDFPVCDGYPQLSYGKLGLLRATDAPEIEVRLVQSKGAPLPYAYGAKGVGELCLIPTAPACAHAYYRRDGRFRTSLPLQATYYKSEK